MENMEFKKVFLGYSPKQVDETISRLTADIEQKDEKLAVYGEKFKELDEKLENLESLQLAERAMIADMMITARQDSERILGIAQSEADNISADAKDSAELIVTEAWKVSERIKADSENEAGAIRRQIRNGYSQFESDMNSIAETARIAREQLQTMFETSENRIMQTIKSVQQMLPETESPVALLENSATADFELMNEG